MSLADAWKDFAQASREVRRETGKSRWTQLAEIVRLRLGRSKLGLAEYYDYRAYRQTDPRALRAFVGWRMQWRLQDALKSPEWSIESTDKLIFYSLCEAWGLPHPEVRAIYVDPNTRHGGSIRTLSSLDEVRGFLSSADARLPLFVKPFRSRTGLGGAGIAGFDAATDIVALTNGERASLTEVLRPRDASPEYWPAGCVLQELLAPHPEIARRCGNRLCTARIIVLLEREGPRIIQAWLRVATGNNMVDNIRHGETGNSFGPVDVATGTVLDQVLDAGFRQKSIRVHPDTGEEIVGFRLPDWEAGKALCLRASLCFGGFRAQGWDVAFTDRGPVLVELNSPFDMDAAQIMASKGMWDDAVDRILEEIGARP
jgi:hypothetical protein